MITEDLNWSTGRLLHPQVKLAACGTSVCREVERVHAAVLGAHVRSRCMLPLEMYLEEGIPLVCYLRHQPHAELVETSEQSMHAFLSISNANAATPALKVACPNVTTCQANFIAFVRKLVSACIQSYIVKRAASAFWRMHRIVSVSLQCDSTSYGVHIMVCT